MPFHWIESVLALAFAAVWAFIGLTLVGDRLHEVRKSRVAPRGPHFAVGRRRAASRRAVTTAG